jgi:hypothetical protein
MEPVFALVLPGLLVFVPVFLFALSFSIWSNGTINGWAVWINRNNKSTKMVLIGFVF